MIRKKQILGLGFFGAMFFIWFFVFVPVNPGSDQEIIFIVQKGQGNKEIGYSLEQQGLIRFSLAFRIYTLATGISKKLQAGAYLLNPGMNVHTIGIKMAKGDIRKQYFTIPEGWNIKNIESYLTEKGFTVSIPSEYEGYLFPDTYELSQVASSQEITTMMQANFNEKFNQTLRNETTKQKKTIQQIVIMASLIEKEVRTPEDKAIVSGILWKRIGIDMPLQVDVAPETYKERGLPQHPIANPGFESLKASLYPQASSYWFYLSKPDGTTVFSVTLEQHNIAKAKYLK